jgi:hypothetical protein
MSSDKAFARVIWNSGSLALFGTVILSIPTFDGGLMKRALITALLLAFGLAQASAVEWLTDLAQAKAKAKQENKVVLMNFTGSDW